MSTSLDELTLDELNVLIKVLFECQYLIGWTKPDEYVHEVRSIRIDVTAFAKSKFGVRINPYRLYDCWR